MVLIGWCVLCDCVCRLLLLVVMWCLGLCLMCCLVYWLMCILVLVMKMICLCLVGVMKMYCSRFFVGCGMCGCKRCLLCCFWFGLVCGMCGKCRCGLVFCVLMCVVLNLMVVWFGVCLMVILVIL